MAHPVLPSRSLIQGKENSEEPPVRGVGSALLGLALLATLVAAGCSRTAAPQLTSCETGLTACGGACVDLDRDPDNCGACGTQCSDSELCVAGQCTSFCPDGWVPCDATPESCADLSSDHDNCGACGNDCGDLVCNQGVCAETCSAGTTDCDGSCVDLSANPSHCGACGSECVFEGALPECVDGVCGIASCLPGRLDCDQDVENGCEVNSDEDVENCGACGNVCVTGPNAEAACNAGTCELTCEPGFADCDGDPENGCEAQLDQDPSNCGACGNDCAGRSCEQGVCTDVCQEGTETCGSELCVDLQSDPLNCGACGNVCEVPNATAACVAGACAVDTCDAGYGDCDGDPANGCEASLDADPLNCGACGNVCAEGIDCQAGVCESPGVLCGGVSCPEPQLCCVTGGMGSSSQCYDPATQVCSGATQECDGASDCPEGQVCCQDTTVWPPAATCESTCTTTVLCSQSSDCPSDAPYCCAVWESMSVINQCSSTPCP